VRNLWASGDGVQSVSSDPGSTIVDAPGEDAPVASADLTMTFLEQVAPRGDSTGLEDMGQDLEEVA
jgi:hypothetical protein